MFVQCGVEGTSCLHWTLVSLMSVGITAAVSTALWLWIVFRRYETTLALPIEYGALSLFSVVGGLLFFQEHEYMDQRQLVLVLTGCGLILLGIRVASAQFSQLDVVEFRHEPPSLPSPVVAAAAASPDAPA